MTNKEQEIGKKIKGLVDDFYKTPIGELPKEHFWIDRDNYLCCGQIRTKIKVDVEEALSLIKKEHKKEVDELKEEKRQVELELLGKPITMQQWRERYLKIKELEQQLQKCEAQKDEIFNDPV